MKTLIRESGKGKMSNLNHFILQFVNSKDIREYLRTIDYELKVPLNQHIPFYVDLHLYNRSDHYFWEGPIMKGAKIYSFWNDEDPRPHFHYRRKDGSEALICFDKPEYLEPSVRLSIQEKLELMRFLSAPTVRV